MIIDKFYDLVNGMFSMVKQNRFHQTKDKYFTFKCMVTVVMDITKLTILLSREAILVILVAMFGEKIKHTVAAGDLTVIMLDFESPFTTTKVFISF